MTLPITWHALLYFWMGSPDKEPLPSNEILDFIADQGVAPHKRPASVGVEDMRKRLTILKEALEFWTNKDRPQVLQAIQNEISDTQARLREYQSQLDGKN